VEANVRSQLRNYIVRSWLSGDERGLDDETDLQQTGILDSFSTLALIAYLESTFHIRLDPTDINSESFRTVDSIAHLVLGKLSSREGT
jgi:acyl carrier protein